MTRKFAQGAIQGWRGMVAVATSFAVISASVAGGMGTTALAQTVDQLHAGCRVDNVDAFRARLVEVTSETFRTSLEGVDFATVVADQWRENRLDPLIDRLVDEHAEVVREETDWDQLLASLASSEKAKALAEDLAVRVYRSDAFKSAVEDLATDAGREIGSSFELATLDAAGPAVRCVRDYLGDRYGRAIAGIVADDTRTEFNPNPEDVAAEVGTGRVVVSGGEAIAGVMVLLVRRTLARMAQRVGQRIVGAVLSRIVSVVAGGIGLILIAKDVWDFRHGVLPIIVEEMKSDSAKQSVRDELSSALEEQMTAQISAVSDGMAERVIGVWQEFRANNAKVVRFAEESAAFKSFLADIDRETMPRVDRIVGIVLESEGEDGIERRLRDGTLDTAVRRLRPAALEIGADRRSLDEAFGWERAVGQRVDEVAEFGLHKNLSADDLSPVALRRLLDVSDRLALRRLSSVPRDALEVFAEFPTDNLRRLARRLDVAELTEFAGYMTGLEPEARDRLLDAVGDDPQRLAPLTTGWIRNAVVASRDQGAAVEMMLRDGPVFNLPAARVDLERVLNGAVKPELLWAKHPYMVVGIGLFVLFALLMLNRVFFGGRRRRSRGGGDGTDGAVAA